MNPTTTPPSSSTCQISFLSTHLTISHVLHLPHHPTNAPDLSALITSATRQLLSPPPSPPNISILILLYPISTTPLCSHLLTTMASEPPLLLNLHHTPTLLLPLLLRRRRLKLREGLQPHPRPYPAVLSLASGGRG
ncbi:hypothetical protein ACFX2I_023960 [Malus domestica]